jgi:hypothetical protein
MIELLLWGVGVWGVGALLITGVGTIVIELYLRLSRFFKKGGYG